MANKNKTTYFLIILTVGLIAGLVIAGRFSPMGPSKAESVEPIPETAQGIEGAVINVASTTGRAVVAVSTEHTQHLSKGGARKFSFEDPSGNNSFGGDPFDRFFDDFFGGMPRKFKQQGMGSGVIIDERGYILTNEHVINGVDKITVKLSDGREFKAELKGKDVRSDLAVIKIDAADLPVAKLGDSDTIKIGQWVVAIGNPFGFVMDNPEPTVTAGVISALHRSLGQVLARNRDYSNLIQTDAAINPGNSGGPLVNLRGEVIGINVAIFSTTGGYQGIGFAIPVNTAKKVLNQLIEGKKILYGWLGVTVQDVNEKLAKYFALEQNQGVLVSKVLKDGPAQKGGIKEGDIIIKIDGQPVANAKNLVSAVTRMSIGRKAGLTIIRDKKESVLQVEIGERPEDLEKVSQAKDLPAADIWRGIKVAAITEELAGQFDLENQKGVVVTGVEGDSLAEEAGIIPGDIIVGIDRNAIANLADYRKALTNAAPGADVLIKTLRGYFIIKGEEKK
ncbi:MAG: Do family serine endopeptidase [Candidatus Omnitrophota bacterium]|nr:Do family serine endopeptidase [Candidatus Omnitrophota bacterium]MDD5654836.1 Do family serine endopeptidase [Candidatus Omnitrophota bacterium]